jgi:pSer/pThr/pTyr-binding forkhead associated (FHA) protein
MAGPSSSPALVDFGSASDGSRHLPVPTQGVAVVGRDPGCDVVVSDQTVSRRHARLEWSNGQLWLEDLGSLGGTFVNNQRLTSAQPLKLGDRIRLGSRSLEYRGPGGSSGSTQLDVAVAAQRSPGASYAIDQQWAPSGQINNNAGNQYQSYVQYVQQVQQQRDSFFKEIAATRTKARVLIWFGLALTVIGFFLFGRLVLLMINAIWGLAFTDPYGAFPPPELAELWNEQIFGVNVGFVGFAICAIGQILLYIGVVLHIVATSRRRRVDRELPVPPPWASYPT